LFAAGCSNDSGSNGSTGGSTATGGTTTTTGGTATGTGGEVATGGTATSTGGSVATGGSSATGGSAVSGGSDTGGAATGGTAMGSGGTNAGTGGTSMGGSGGGKAGSTSGGAAGASATGGSAGASTGGSGGGAKTMSFFVSSQTSKTGNLGGLKAADMRCQTLAAAVGLGDKTWHAYLSADADPDSNGMPVNARDRIGKGPWYNQKGVLLAADLDSLHMRKGDAEVFIDEKGGKINGQWSGSPTPNEHDILTGSKADGTLSKGQTCDNWTSAASSMKAGVGHSDGLGPNMATTGTYTSWNAAHANGGCNDTAPQGGAGRIYCFVVN
jgi:hypothetical protein